MRRGVSRSLAAMVALGAALLAPGLPAQAASPAYAPPDRPGPALSVPTATLAAALTCHGNFADSSLEPVLLNPATGVTPEQNYSWNYERAFTAEGRPWCAVTVPNNTLGDIQTAAEYIVYAIRTENAMAHRKIAVLGHSQGGMSMRWPLRFWPDTRPMVDDIIGMAGSNHGTTVPNLKVNCQPGVTNCPPAVWQQGSGSNFIQALNSAAETWPGISYTEIFTHRDEVVQPNDTDADSSSALHTGAGQITNVSIQDICPTDTSEHLQIGTTDPAAYALVHDALENGGPADVSRVKSNSTAICSQPYQPGVDPASAQTYLQALAGIPGLSAVSTPDFNIVGAPEVPNEPALRCYVFAAGCQGTTGTGTGTGSAAAPASTSTRTPSSNAAPVNAPSATASSDAPPATPVVGTPNFTG